MKKNLFLGKWLLVVIMIVFSTPTTIGRGGGGGGNGGGKKGNGSCEVAVATKIDLDFPDAALIPNRNLSVCPKVPKQGSDPLVDAGASSLSDGGRFFLLNYYTIA
ncbi:MAG: hypothetical protein ACK40K_05315 [Raineya sp.]